MSFFYLADIPPTYELRLSDKLVETLNRLNRPWMYDGSTKRGRKCYVWRASERLCKRLWGYSRYRRRKKQGYDNGAFIKMEHVGEILNRTNIPYWMIEDNIIGFKAGPSGRELKSQLPIKPDKWWAKLLGFYWSSGGFFIRQRRGNCIEKYVRIAIDDTVIPMLQEIGEHIGDPPTIASYVPIYKGPHHHKHLGSRVRQPIFFSASTLEVLIKFGIVTEKNSYKGSKSTARRLVKPTVPDWVRKDEEYSRSFIEGYINGQRGHSMMYTLQKHGVARGLTTQVLIRFVGYPAEKVKVFGQFFRDWFNKHGVTGYFRKMPELHDGANRMPRYEFVIHNKIGLNFIFENFEIRRPDMRARLILKRNLKQDYPLFAAIQQLSSTEIVTLGIIYEKVRTLEELNFNLRIRPERIKEILANLEAKGLIETKDGEYYVALTLWKNQLILSTRKKLEFLKNKVFVNSTMLPCQCVECGAVFPRQIKCAICGKDTEPVERIKVLRPLVMRMHSAERKIIKLGGAI